MHPLEFNTTVFVELKDHQHIARMEQTKNFPARDILDPPRTASQNDGPKRMLILGVATSPCFARACGAVLAHHSYRASPGAFRARFLPQQKSS
jgi:hypothetical protein